MRKRRSPSGFGVLGISIKNTSGPNRGRVSAIQGYGNPGHTDHRMIARRTARRGLARVSERAVQKQPAQTTLPQTAAGECRERQGELPVTETRPRPEPYRGSLRILFVKSEPSQHLCRRRIGIAAIGHDRYHRIVGTFLDRR